ncbi:unknown [Clostridium sp. CAG:417]|nr:unknown [Clostridium sp. CAG:417]
MRKKQKHYLSIIIILILCITIGYAYLSSTLNGEITTVNIYPVTRKCQRAKTLHSITCTSSSTEGYCKAGRRKDSITFGQIGTSGKLASGDAFDCDVNGDGIFNDAAERFYYVSDLNSSTAILIYYTYTNRYPYNAQTSNSYSGPITAVGALPTTTKWSNISLVQKTSQIYNHSGGTTVVDSSNKTHTLPKYTYTTAARLLTLTEYNKITNTDIFWENFGNMDPNCVWLNTPLASGGGSQVMAVYNPAYTSIATMPYSVSTSCAVKPVIEVSKGLIVY